MVLADRWGFANVDSMLDLIEPAGLVEWMAFNDIRSESTLEHNDSIQQFQTMMERRFGSSR